MPVKPATADQRRTLVADAMSIIDTEYAQDLRLDMVAHRIATSRRQLQRAFQETTGGGFRDALTHRRMEVGGRLLGETPFTVRQVASAVGYSQPAQFAKAFRAYHGHTPREHRRLSGAGAPFGAPDDPVAGRTAA